MRIRAKPSQTKSHWIIKWFKVVLEGNRCRFAKVCKLYQERSAACNNLNERLLEDDKIYCGRYRSMQEDE